MGVDTGRLRVVAAEAVDPEPRSELRRRGKSQRKVEAAKASAATAEPSVEAQVESTEGFHSPGPYIKAQRRRRGMSLEQLAAVTKIPRAQLELIEADRYDELPGMVFAKGFLRCSARALDLDPDKVIGLLYERERTALRKRRREVAANVVEDKPLARASDRGARPNPASLVQQRIAGLLAQLPSSRILMWLVVALLVALVVFIAFTLASSQAQTMMIRS